MIGGIKQINGYKGVAGIFNINGNEVVVIARDAEVVAEMSEALVKAKMIQTTQEPVVFTCKKESLQNVFLVSENVFTL